MNTFIDEEIHLKILRLLQDNSRITQREMNRRMGVSVGKINYCISALSEKGLIKIEQILCLKCHFFAENQGLP